MNPQGREILIVDDSEELRDFYALILKACGYRVQVASSGEEALRLVRESRPDALIVDVVMPGMDGFELLTRMRSDLAPPLPPAVVCSGFDVTAEEAVRRGALAFMSKPVDPDDLVRTLETVLSGQSPDTGAVAHARKYAQEGRARARDRAESALAAASLVLLNGRMTEWFDWLARYFDVAMAGIVVVHRGELHLLDANASAPVRPGTLVGGELSPCIDLVETGEILIISDIHTHPSFGEAPRVFDALVSFAGVPLCDEHGVAFGALCIADTKPRRWSAEDTYLLSAIGRRGSEVLQHAARTDDKSLLVASAFLRVPLFEALLDMEARTLHRVGGALEIAIAQLDSTDGLAACADAIWRLPNLQRTAVASTDDRLLAFKRATDDAATTATITAILELVRPLMPIRCVVRVSMEGTVGSIDGMELRRIADQLLTDGGDGTDRVVIRRAA